MGCAQSFIATLWFSCLEGTRMDIKWILIAAILLQGCASKPPISKYAVIAPDGIVAIHGQAVRVKAAPTPDFIISTNADQATMTVGMLFGAIGGGIGAAVALEHMKSAGHAAVTVHAIVDPTQQLVARIEADLLSKYGITVGESHYELDVAILNWALAKDDVVYAASVKVLDESATPPRLLATGECRFNTIADKDKLTAEELLANHAEKLKQVFDRAMDQCVKDFDEKVFL